MDRLGWEPQCPVFNTSALGTPLRIREKSSFWRITLIKSSGGGSEQSKSWKRFWLMRWRKLRKVWESITNPGLKFPHLLQTPVTYIFIISLQKNVLAWNAPSSYPCLENCYLSFKITHSFNQKCLWSPSYVSSAVLVTMVIKKVSKIRPRPHSCAQALYRCPCQSHPGCSLLGTQRSGCTHYGIREQSPCSHGCFPSLEGSSTRRRPHSVHLFFPRAHLGVSHVVGAQ